MCIAIISNPDKGPRLKLEAGLTCVRQVPSQQDYIWVIGQQELSGGGGVEGLACSLVKR